MALKEENELAELELSDDSDLSSEESIDFDSPKKTKFAMCMCRERTPEVLIGAQFV